MAKHRLTTTFALLALALLGALAPAASASSTLLSGYGGPGQGNQAILGSTLIGGSGGGSGSSGGGAPSPQSVSIEASPAPGTGVPPTRVPPTRAGGNGSGTASHQGKAPRSTGAVSGRAEGPLPALTATSASAPALGLSGSDVAYVVAVLVVLALTALVTVLLTRGSGATRGGPGATGSG